MKRQKLIELRLAQGASQVDMARKAGMSMDVVLRLEKGGMCHPRTIPKLAQAYGLTPAEFVTILFEDGAEQKGAK